jgi:DNA-binding XRE family transcriptional regulator
MKTKTVKNYVDHTLGFPVHLGTVTLVPFRDEWVPRINYNQVDLNVLAVLSHLSRPLTGAEIRFVRQYFKLTLAAFAAKFGVSHVAVHKWEQHKDQPTGMQWSTEKDLRLFIQSKLSDDPKAVGMLYGELTERPKLSRGEKRVEMVKVTA